MSTTRSGTPVSTHHRSFGPDESALDDEPTIPQSTIRRALGRISFSTQHRPSFARLRGSGERDAEPATPASERPPIPTILNQPSEEAYSTPLPVLSMIVLSIAMLGEFLSASVCTPFLLFMVNGFGTLADEAEVAFWTGILVSTFFATQFLTSLLWATVAEKHGRRLVLVVSLLGSAVTCAIFGTCTSLKEAICVRLLQGIFAGAVGVARGSISFVTDASNEGRAYAILGFCWGFGGVAGAIIGGTFERPAEKWPGVFTQVPLFAEYPYLLPCVMASSITLFGSFLGCFLGHDGGPREGAIHLQPEKVATQDPHPPIPEEDSTPPSPIFDDDCQAPQSFTRALGRRVQQRLSGYFGSKVQDAQNVTPSPSPVPLASSVGGQGLRMDRTRTFSTSRTNGSAYGYTGTSRNRLASNAAGTLRGRRWSNASSMRRRRGSGNPDAYRESHNFAQRLLMANENAVTNIADLWVASAMNADYNDDPFYDDDDDMLDDESEVDFGEVLDADDDHDDNIPPSSSDSPSPTAFRGRSGSRSSTAYLLPPSTLPSSHRPSVGSITAVGAPLNYGSPRRPTVPLQIPGRGQLSSTVFDAAGTPMSRRHLSMREPSIFAHTGVRTPSAVLDAQQLLTRAETEIVASDPALAPIRESHRVSRLDADTEAGLPEKVPSLTQQLPILVIIQYGLLALHSTTHDQLFMSYLVTDFDSGGLNLNAGHFAQLIALMCLCQIAYQFYLYPNIGPPRGRFSHLAMFRLGSLLFIPAYLTVILYHPLASEDNDGNFLLMSALAISTAVRFCGNTFAYTAVAILLNYMTPPSAVGFANGIAQSIVSLARCFGPVLGGYLWSVSIEGHPEGYPLGFIVCSGVCLAAVLHSFWIR